MRKISSVVNTSMFEAQILTKLFSIFFMKWTNILTLLHKRGSEDNSTAGYFKWIVRSDHLAHEILCQVTDKDFDDESIDLWFSKSFHKLILKYVKNNVLSEDLIYNLILKFNADNSNENKHNLESACLKIHHQMFYNLMEMLRLIEYIAFKSPSLSILYHFICDKLMLTKLKDLLISIIDLTESKTHLSYYTKILNEISKRIKNKVNKTHSWSNWIFNSKESKTKPNNDLDFDDVDGKIWDSNEQEDDEEDMCIVLTNINHIIINIFNTLERVFIMHDKNDDISDLLSNLIKLNFNIRTKQNEYTSLFNKKMLVRQSKQDADETGKNLSQLLTISAIIPFL